MSTINAVIITMIWLRFDGRSTAYQRSSKSQWYNGRWPATCNHADLFTYLCLSTPAYTQI